MNAISLMHYFGVKGIHLNFKRVNPLSKNITNDKIINVEGVLL
jgi:hypothetical protein